MTPHPRLLLVDENIRNADGHYLELAQQLIQGAKSLGYAATLATHRSFCPDDIDDPSPVAPAFRSRQLRVWSLGVDGYSHSKRDRFGSPCGASKPSRLWHQFRDPMSRRERRPNVMLREWSTDFVRLLEHWQPTTNDRILINTADDFVMRALANAVHVYGAERPLDISAIFHFALYHGDHVTNRAREYGEQVLECLSEMSSHQVSLFATTQPLADQLAQVGIDAKAVAYPTRARSVSSWKSNQPLKILMAGMPRAEKGRGKIHELLCLIEQHLCDGGFQVSIQMRNKSWKRLIPTSLHEDYLNAVKLQASGSTGPLEIISSNLPAQEYQAWLGSADIGLFLYDPVRYVARCSGVLLEMFVAGIPVIVPEKCWLGEQVLGAGGNGVIGYTYKSIDEIPQLLMEIQNDYPNIRERAAQRSREVVAEHSGESTLSQMNFQPVSSIHRKAS